MFDVAEIKSIKMYNAEGDLIVDFINPKNISMDMNYEPYGGRKLEVSFSSVGMDIFTEHQEKKNVKKQKEFKEIYGNNRM